METEIFKRRQETPSRSADEIRADVLNALLKKRDKIIETAVANLKKHGYEDREIKITVTPDDPLNFSVEVEPKPLPPRRHKKIEYI